MSNTSATGGYLSPSGIPTDAEIDAILQKLVVGISGISGTLVRPRWQPTPVTQPNAAANWCAVGVMTLRPDENAHVQHNPAALGTDTVRLHWALEAMASFYGPLSQHYGMRLKLGLAVNQNRALLRANNWGVHQVNELRHVPELVNAQWIKRTDLMMDFRFQTTTTYAVLNLLSVEGDVSTPENTTPFGTP